MFSYHEIITNYLLGGKRVTILLDVKSIFCLGMIFLTGAENCAREAVLIRRVREMDGLQKHSSELLDRSVFSVRIAFGAENLQLLFQILKNT